MLTPINYIIADLNAFEVMVLKACIFYLFMNSGQNMLNMFYVSFFLNKNTNDEKNKGLHRMWKTLKKVNKIKMYDMS